MIKIVYVIRFVVIVMLLSITITDAFGQKSDKLKPEWIKNPPKPANSSYYFKVTETDNGQNLNSSRILSQKDLISSIEREFNIEVSEELDSKSKQSVNNSNLRHSTDEIYSLKIKSSDGNVRIYYEKVDEYYESSTEGGYRVFKLYTLYAVSRSTTQASFDKFTLTNKYGFQGAWRSVILPGWGQLHKGSKTKGALVMSGVVAFAGGIIVTENLRTSYLKKIKETHDINAIKTYAKKSDDMQNIRNICIGGAIAVYLYNIIDAAAASGAKRVLVTPKGQRGFSLQPALTRDMGGLSLTYNF